MRLSCGRFSLILLVLFSTVGRAEDRDKLPLFNTFFLDADRETIRLTLNRDRTCELRGPDGQVVRGRFTASDEKLLVFSGAVRRHFAYRFENGDVLLTATNRDQPGGADLLGGLLPTRREEERRYVSWQNWKARERERASRGPQRSVAAPADGTAPVAEPPSALRRVAADVPMQLSGERILLPIRINDEIDCRALLDTGAHCCVLDLGQVDLKKPKLEGERTLLFPYIGKVQAQELVLRSVALGRHRLEEHTVPVVRNRLFWGRHAPFLLGMDVLKAQPFTLDFVNRRFILWMPGSVLPEPAGGATRLKLDLLPGAQADDCRPYIKAAINGASGVLFLVDTGAPDTFFLRALNPAAQGFTERRPLGSMPTYVGENFEDVTVWGALYRRIDLGEWRLQDQPGSILDLSAHQRRVYSGDLDSLSNLVGTRFLRNMRAVHFDIPNKAMYLDRPE